MYLPKVYTYNHYGIMKQLFYLLGTNYIFLKQRLIRSGSNQWLNPNQFATGLLR